jgi:FkbM family methyltransferase
VVEIVESWDGLKWYVEREGDRVVLSKGELSVLRAVYALAAAPGFETFVDVGAHVGYHAVRAARKFREVIALEPNPRNREVLARNVALNELHNVRVLPHAAGEARYTATLWLADAGSTLLPGIVRGETVEVEVAPLDELVSRADVIKIDVEGYDWRVIQGARRLIEAQRPALIVEHHDSRPQYAGTVSDYPRIKRFLRERGYIEMYLTGAHRLWYPLDRPLEPVGELVAHHWIQHCINNLRQGRDWYYGLPYTWWWGMHFIDFIHEIHEHALRPDEPEWTERLLRDSWPALKH